MNEINGIGGVGFFLIEGLVLFEFTKVNIISPINKDDNDDDDDDD